MKLRRIIRDNCFALTALEYTIIGVLNSSLCRTIVSNYTSLTSGNILMKLRRIILDNYFA